MQPKDHATVTIEDITPYSVIHLQEREKQHVLALIDEDIERSSAADSVPERRVSMLRDLRQTIADTSPTLRLTVGEHDRLRTVLRGAASGNATHKRLRDAEPECDWCDESGYMQLRVDDSDPWTICTDCKTAVLNAHAHHLLQWIDGRITADTELTYDWPTQDDTTATNQ